MQLNAWLRVIRCRMMGICQSEERMSDLSTRMMRCRMSGICQSGERMSDLSTSVHATISTMATGEGLNSTNGSGCPTETAAWIVSVVPVCILVFTALGIVFNVFVLMVFFLHKKACTVPEIYLSNMAAADLVLLACLPFWAVNLSKKYNWIFGRVLCRLVNLGINMNVFCSIYFIVLVSIDRYVALVHTMSHNRMRRPKYARLGCVMVWGFGLLMGVPTLVYREVKTICNHTECILEYSLSEHLLFQGLQIAFSFIIPIFIISFCTFKILKALKNRLMEGSNSQNVEHKATTLVLAVLLAFVICWLPFHVFRIVELLKYSGMSKASATVVDTCIQIFVYLAYFNSVLNPLLYVIVGKNFRKKALEVFSQQGPVSSFNTASTRTSLSRSFKLVNFSS
ncbi:B2 bradykinin receptor-like isoform X1 [Sparus aurata]|nr:B2 bradykinin receptor-like isoform X1 [Sparus aurata]